LAHSEIFDFKSRVFFDLQLSSEFKVLQKLAPQSVLNVIFTRTRARGA